jgi:hypothetical protein
MWSVRDLDHRSMINSSLGSQSLTKLNIITNSIYVEGFLIRGNLLWPWIGISYHRGEVYYIF